MTNQQPDLARLTGLQIMQGMFAGNFPRAPMGELMGMSGGSAGEGWVEFIGVPGAQHYNPIGTVHGGYAATLLDSCMGCAVHTSLPAGMGYSTIDLTVTYIRAMTVKTGPVTARGDIVSSGKRLATARGTLTDGEGRIIATGMTSCLVFPIGELARR